MQKRIVALRKNREAIDAAIRIFDPSKNPHTIKPKRPKLKPKTFTRYGECARAILSLLRVAVVPMTQKEIVDRLIADYRLNLETKPEIDALVSKVQGVLHRHKRKGIVRSARGSSGQIVWSVAEE